MRFAVIGGGPAGLMAAIEASKSPAKVTLFEHEARVGRKLLVTGAGRCNISNDAVSSAAYHQREAAEEPRLLTDWLDTLLEKFSVEDLQTVMYDLGVPLFSTDDGWYYPVSQSAASVLAQLEERLLGQGGLMRVATHVEGVFYKEGEGFELKIKDLQSGSWHHEVFDKVIIATGGKSYPELGSRGELFGSIAKLGHTVTPLSPALGPIEMRLGAFIALQGQRFDVHTSLYDGDTLLGQSAGNVIFTKKGLNGPGAMNISHLVSAHPHKKLQLQVNFIGDYLEDFSETVTDEKQAHSLMSLLLRYFAPKASHFFIEQAGLNRRQKVQEMDEAGFQALLNVLSMWRFDVTGAGDFSNSQVTAGGVPCTELDPISLESQLVKGLYIIGETIDVFGPCGGYNLHIALATGYLAGKALAELTKHT